MINVTKTYLPDREKYKQYIDQIFDSGWFTNNGKMVQQLQERLSRYLGVRNLLLVSSGTLALQVAYKLLGLKGDVLTTPFSFVATTSSLVWEGLNPIFVDIDKESLCLDSKKIEDKITSETTGIVATHVYGNPCEIEKIEDISRKYNLKVIYDAAHAFDVKYKQDSIYSYGDVSIASFHSTKIFHTIEGGALIIRDDKLFEQAKRMINFGIESPECISLLGINAKMNEFQAAMGLCVLDDIESILGSRRKKYEYYWSKLTNIENIKLLRKHPDASNNYSHFPVIFENESMLLETMSMLKNENIYPRRYFYPSLDSLPYLLGQDNDVPVSRDISHRVLCLPFSDSIEEEVQNKVIQTIISVCESNNYLHQL